MKNADIDRVLENAVHRGALPHVVGVAADRDGVIYEGAAGSVAVGREESVGPDSMFRIASMTKIVGTIAVLQLVERGEVDLETPVDTLVPEFGELQVIEGFDGDTPRLRRPTSRATVRNLVTHTAGSAYWFWNDDVRRWEEHTGTPNASTGTRRVFTTPLVADPGSSVVYGMAGDWLGQVIEAVSGRSLDEYFAANVFAPLGMDTATFSPTDKDRENLVAVHVPGEDGWLATDFDWVPEPEYWSSGHGLYATPREFLRLQRMLLNRGSLDGVRVLAAESVDAAFRNQIGELDFPVHISAADAAIACPWNGPAGLKWGYGLLLNPESQPGMRKPWSGAWGGLFNSQYWIDPESGVTGAIYSQFLPFLTPEAVTAYADFERALYASR
jgi:methyl acetate hydrolase